MGKPSVRFDEGRERVGHWPCASQSDLSCLLYLRCGIILTAALCIIWCSKAAGNILPLVPYWGWAIFLRCHFFLALGVKRSKVKVITT